MPSKKQRLKKKRDNIAKRKNFIAVNNNDNGNDINVFKQTELENQRTFNQTLEKGRTMLLKVHAKYDGADDYVVKSLIYNSIITRIGKIVNQFKPIKQTYNTINNDITPKISIDLDEYKAYEYIDPVHNSDIQFFNDNYDAEFDNTLDTMSLENLEHLDFLIQTLIVDYYELDDNSQYVQNYIDASSKGDNATYSKPKEDLNEIVREQLLRAHNDPDRTFELIEGAYEDMAAEKFDNSDKVERENALNKHQHKGGNNDLTPQQIKELKKK